MDKHTATSDMSIPRPPSAASSRSPSSHGDYPEPFVLSGTNTPSPRMAKTPSHEARPEAAASPMLHPDDPRLKTAVPRSSGRDSNPIAIEKPILPRKPRTAAESTPPAPLSARGDVPGGYFPLHEDPTKRVHRPHPFDESESPQSASSPKGKAKAPKTAAPSLNLDPPSAKRPPGKPTDTLLTSYVPSGLHTGSLPMGKYYPSNYETRSQPKPPPKPATAKSATHVPTHAGPQRPPPEGGARQKLQQYQRDMVAQATLAARKLMRGAHEGRGPAGPALPAHGLATSAPPTANPNSPRLRPIGSPGPVTPMELEGPEGSYLDKGSRDGGRRQPMSPGNRMRAETRSPVATPAF